jgi:phosphate transport system substrate-binding protein
VSPVVRVGSLRIDRSGRRLQVRLLTVLAAGIAWLGMTAARAEAVLPEYRPTMAVSGTLRNYGGDFGGLLQRWEDGFRHYHPELKFADTLSGSDVATAGLITGAADIGTSGREAMLVELEAFHDSAGTELVQIPVATGTLDVKATTWTPVIIVRDDNPIKGLTLRQLDGIFGAPRTGGYQGYHWSPEGARSAHEDIRTWDQLGLRGEWTGKPIQTLGYAPTGMTNFFQQVVMNGGSKWNPNYREYVEAGSKLIAPSAGGDALGTDRMFAAVNADKFAIAWGGLRQSRQFPRLRVVPLAARDGGPYVLPTRESLQNRTYPLARFIYMFVHMDSNGQCDPRVKEFLSYVLSEQGQHEVTDGNVYLPLTAEIVAAQRRRFE